jgi:4-methylaminobutanoate oxidase (formaldehyde-forming)
VTARYAQINVQGPRSRQLLETVTNSSVCNEAFPFRHVKNIEVDLAQVLCCRITYVGELGYELLVPVEQACLVYDRIVDAGSSLGLKHAGLKALGSLRMVGLY